MQGDWKSEAVFRPFIKLTFPLQSCMLKWRMILQKLGLKGTKNTEHDLIGCADARQILLSWSHEIEFPVYMKEVVRKWKYG